MVTIEQRDISLAQDALYAAMLAGITSDPPWQAFVQSLLEMFGANHTNVIFRNAGSQQMFIAQASSKALARFEDLEAGYDAAIDPMPYFQMRPFRAYRLAEFVAPDVYDQHPFIARFLKPFGMDELLICRVRTPARLQAWVSLTRPGGCRFTADDMRTLEHVAQNFAAALDVFGRIKATEDERDAYARIAQARAAGVLRLDQNGAVIHSDATARMWLSEGRTITLAADRLKAPDRQDHARLAASVARILAGASDEEFLVLGAGGGESLELLLFRVSDPSEPAWTAVPRIIAYMCMNGREALPSPQRLRVKFDLSRREAALCILLVRGFTLAQASIDLGISLQTARAYLKQIFRKVGVGRQAELIRTVQAGIGAVF